MVGAKHYEANPHDDLSLRSGVVIVQRAARAPERGVPRAPGGARRAAHRAARALHRRRLGRRGAPLPPEDGEPRADRAAHGARVRRRGRPPRGRQVGDLRHRAARPRGRRGVHRTLRCARCSRPTRRPSSAAASRVGTSPTTASSRRPSGGASGRAHPGCELRVVDPETLVPLPTGEVGLLEVQAAQLAGAGLDPHHRPRPHRRRRLRLDPRAAPTRPSCAAASRCSPTSCAARWSATRRCGARRCSASTTIGWGRCRWRSWSCGPPATVTADDLLAYLESTARALRAARAHPDRRRAATDGVGEGRSRRDARVVRGRGPVEPMTGASPVERWTFGEQPLDETQELARGAARPDGDRAGARAAVRRAARARRGAAAPRSERLAALAPADLRPARRRRRSTHARRVYLDHSRDVGDVQRVLPALRDDGGRRPRRGLG